jgi:hypothetical protein
MKPTILKSKHRSPLNEAVEGKSNAGAGWMRTGDQIAKEIKRNKAESMTNMVPSFWLQADETKQVRFLSSKPIAAIYRYSVKVRGRWRKYTQPAPGMPDPFADSGLSPYLVTVYEIIDVTGYIGQDKKRVRNVRKFWEVGGRIEANLSKILQKFGDLTKFNIEVSRDGEGTKATYTFLPEPPSPIPVPKDKDPLTPKFSQFFAPLTTERMSQLVGRPSSEDEDGDE